jgi:hypothetical protein
MLPGVFLLPQHPRKEAFFVKISTLLNGDSG